MRKEHGQNGRNGRNGRDGQHGLTRTDTDGHGRRGALAARATIPAHANSAANANSTASAAYAVPALLAPAFPGSLCRTAGAAVLGLGLLVLFVAGCACPFGPKGGRSGAFAPGQNASPTGMSAAGFTSLDSLWRPAEGVSSARVAQVLSIRPESSVVIGEIEGPAVVRHIWMTVQSVVPTIHGLLVLRVWWDDEPEPSVEVPLGDFFGVGFGEERTFRSAMVGMFPAGAENHAGLNCYWPMPFHKKARFEIENRSRRPVSMFFFQADYEKHTALPPDTMYFHAQWRRENPVRKGIPFTILETEGRGAYVGTVLNYRLLGPGGWVEGGNDVYIDGAESPTMPATGGEDYFGHAWGFRPESNALFHGTSYGPDEDDRMTAYRWHILDPIHFSESIRMTMKCHGWDVGPREDDYASVAFWYQTEPHAPFPEFPPVDWEYLRVPEDLQVSATDLFTAEHLPPTPPGRNLALEAVDSRASGRYDESTDATYAFDGKLETKWCDATIHIGQWLALDLGATRSVTGCRVMNTETAGDPAGFNTRVFRVEVGPSLDGPWTAVARVDSTLESTNPDLGSPAPQVEFDEPVAARFVRLVIEDAGYLDPIARVQEFEVYGR